MYSTQFTPTAGSHSGRQHKRIAYNKGQIPLYYSSRPGSRAGLRPALAKFHYAIHVADLVADLVSDLSQTGSSYLDM